MRTRLIKEFLLVISVVALLISGYVVPVSAQGPGPSAQGNATSYNANGDPITSSFNVRVDRDGLARGQWETHRPVPTNDNERSHAALNCLYLIDDHTASIGGVVTHANEEGYHIGAEFIFLVVDNGEGESAPPDEVSFVCFSQWGSDCTNMDAINACDNLFEEVIRGDVQVKP
jgi:hypothetical protein